MTTFFPADLVELSGLDTTIGAVLAGDVAYVTKRNASDPNTDGGGAFIYQDGFGPDGPDGGTIINGQRGQWFRIEASGPVRAEWFGAKGDGEANDMDAINACLGKYQRVNLFAKTYLVSPTGTNFSIGIGDNYVVEGAGIDKTVLVFSGGLGPSWPNNLTTIVTAQDVTGHNSVVRDLTIDCGFNESGTDRPKTRMAIGIVGGNALVERVKAINFGVGTATTPTVAGECFVILLQTDSINWHLGTIQDCIVMQPGVNGSGVYPGAIPEITCLTLLGHNNGTPGFGGQIVRNKIQDCYYTSTVTGANDQFSPLHGITIGACSGTEIAENEIVNFDGGAVWWMSWKDQDVLIRNNRFWNVNLGVFVSVQASGGVAVQAPYHLRTTVRDNSIMIGGYQNQSEARVGIQLFIGPGLTDDGTGARLADIWLERNIISSSNTPTGPLPVGIYVYLNSPLFKNIHIEDNRIEIPDPGGAAPLNLPYENCIVFAPTSLYLPNEIHIHGNRNLAGTELRLKIATFSPEVGSIGPQSDRIGHFETTAPDGRSALVYEEFVGQPPGFALGWALEESGGGGVQSNVGQEGQPGIATLTTGPAATDFALLKYASDAVLLSPTAAGHIFEFSALRATIADSSNDYDVRMGVISELDYNHGAFFNIGSSNNHHYLAYWFTDDDQLPLDTGVSDNPPTFKRFRIEIPRGLTEVRFFIDGKHVGTKKRQTPLAGSNLTFMFRIARINASVATFLSVDYFQHQVLY